MKEGRQKGKKERGKEQEMNEQRDSEKQVNMINERTNE